MVNGPDGTDGTVSDEDSGKAWDYQKIPSESAQISPQF